eukprot:TRINITY_DN62741_c0_g1_i1.p1 TRINITY_DN62741_c0_g1~~TRINITY_DN62741_c0_g1_i1.p1  ORF type:complete len:173 (+),score=33.25 TRINITY_DN62741_c0_g1_i1:140-658(+)
MGSGSSKSLLTGDHEACGCGRRRPSHGVVVIERKELSKGDEHSLCSLEDISSQEDSPSKHGTHFQWLSYGGTTAGSPGVDLSGVPPLKTWKRFACVGLRRSDILAQRGRAMTEDPPRPKWFGKDEEDSGDGGRGGGGDEEEVGSCGPAGNLITPRKRRHPGRTRSSVEEHVE